MDIEKELEILIDKHKGKQVGVGEIRLDWFAEDCLKEIRKLKAKIARQSVTSEEVAEAIEHLEYWRKNNYKWEYKYVPCGNDINLAITALQAYQPTISKTETTSWTMIDSDINLWQCSECKEEWHFEYGGTEENNMHYCPNCGR